MVVDRFRTGGGGGYAHTTVEQASGTGTGSSDGTPSLPVIGAVAVVGYAAYRFVGDM